MPAIDLVHSLHLNYERGQDITPLWYPSSMYASLSLSSPSLPGSPMLTEPDLHRDIALHGVYKSHSVFIRSTTGCLEIHKLIRWVFMNLMCYIVYNKI